MKVQESLKEMGTLLLVGSDKEIFNLLPLGKIQWNSTLFYCGTLFLYMTKFLDFFGSTWSLQLEQKGVRHSVHRRHILL